MLEENNKELIFKENLEEFVDSFGEGNQDGIKAILRECQELFSCVSISHQKQIAEGFKVKENLVKTVMKFMPSIKESIVEYEVICCSGARCGKNGSLEVVKAVKEGLDIDFGETSKDGRVRLSTQNCFKQCNLGPNIMVNGKMHNHMDREKAKDLVKEIKS